MAERFKLKLSRVIPSLQICRPKDPSASVHNPVPAVYRLSPVNSKVFDISFPNNNLPPAPPPTTPEGHFIKRQASTNTYQTTSSPVWVNKNKKKTIASVSSRASGCFSSDEDESETLINRRKKKKVNTNMKQIRRQRRKASMNYKELDVTVVGVVSPVRGSVAVVKKSVDPYEDFKRSMLEMILKKQMFEAKDLEQLLFCFLTLNSKKYHGIIVEAFSDIWEILFCD